MSRDNYTQTIRSYDNNYFLHPWEDLSTFGHQNRTVICRAEGIYLYDSKGRELIDGPGGMWCVQIGHGRIEMAEAIAEQATKMTYTSPWGLANEPAALLAKKIADLAPGDLKHVFFTTGGSTAVDSAVRFVHFYNNILGRPEKKLIISRQKAYHGSTYIAASCSGKERDRSFFDISDMVHFVPAPNPYWRPEGMSIEAFCDAKVKDLEDKILELGSERVGAFIAEPILASGGVIVPPEGYQKRCLEVCREYDVLYISDEVVTAFGRLGHWFASKDVFEFEPDIITCAKGITSGYVPLGAVLISDRTFSQVMSKVGGATLFSNGFTFGGHPVACAAALKNIEIIEREGILEHVREIAPHFQDRLQELRNIPIVGDVRGMGLMGCVESVVDSGEDDALALDKEMGARIDEHCQRLGLIVRPLINMNVFSPPLIITHEQIDDMVDRLRKGISNAWDDVRRQPSGASQKRTLATGGPSPT